jgi:hypothetical protein
MKRRSALLCLVFFSSIFAVAAQSGSLPTTGSTPVPQPSPLFPRTGRGSQTASLQVPVNNSSERDLPPQGLALQQMIVHTYAQPIYRKPTEKELEAIAPQPGIRNKYRELLAKENTGVFRLVADHNCSENSKVVSAADECLKYTMPGAGSSFSFRTESYRIRDLADLNYSGTMLRITGMMMQGILVDLGDIAIEDVTLQSKGLKYLVEFQPVTDFEEARAIDEEIVVGVSRDGFIYKRSLPVVENRTYALRVVAYRGKLFKSVGGVRYNEFDFDKRRDVIVAFRVAFRDTDESVTIVWKQLTMVDAPKLKPPDSGNAARIPANVAVQKPSN